MKKAFWAVALLVLAFSAGSVLAAERYSPATPVKVSGYTTKNGTHVDSYWRALPGHGCGGSGCKK